MILKFRHDKKALWWWVNGHYIAGNSSQACELLLNDPVDLSGLYQAIGAGGGGLTWVGVGGGGAGGSSHSSGVGCVISGGDGGSGVIDVKWSW